MTAIDVPGRCRCGAVTFRLREEPIAFYVCHCTDCQADSGSAFGQSMHVKSETVTDVDGNLLRHRPHDGATQAHCERCMTPIWYQRDDLPQVMGLNAGCLDDVAGLTPYGNMWTRSARPWVAFAPGPRFETQPEDPAAMHRAWAARPRDDEE